MTLRGSSVASESTVVPTRIVVGATTTAVSYLRPLAKALTGDGNAPSPVLFVDARTPYRVAAALVSTLQQREVTTAVFAVRGPSGDASFRLSIAQPHSEAERAAELQRVVAVLDVARGAFPDVRLGAPR